MFERRLIRNWSFKRFSKKISNLYVIHNIISIEFNELKEMNSENLFPDPSKTLQLHRKHQHLSYSERWHIYKLIVAGDHNKNSLSSKFNIGISTINNIWKEFRPQNRSKSSERRWGASKILQSIKLRRFIINFVETHHNPFTSDDILHEVKENFGITLQKHQLIKFLKEELTLSLKKVRVDQQIWTKED